MMTRDIFISHSTNDADKASAICAVLEVSGHSCWMAPRDIMPPQSYADAIEEAISEVQMVVLVFSASANESSWVEAELERAASYRKPILTFAIDSASPCRAIRLLISKNQRLDATVGPFDQKLRELLQCVDAEVGRLAADNGRRPQAGGLSTAERLQTAAPATAERAPAGTVASIALLYKRKAAPDEEVLTLLETRLQEAGHRVFVDRHLVVGMEWAKEIERQVSQSDFVIPLVSENAVTSEMLALEIQIANEARQVSGKPRILPVRICFEGPLPEQLGVVLDPLEYTLWNGPKDNETLLSELSRALRGEARPPARSKGLPYAGSPGSIPVPGGAMPTGSDLYVRRDTDDQVLDSVGRSEGIILIKGPRQIGKSSLLARALDAARQAGDKIVITDFQKLDRDCLGSPETFYKQLGAAISDELDLDVFPEDIWHPRRTAAANFERFMTREVLAKVEGRIIWGMDEVDRLFTCDFGGEVFGLFRAWYNERALDPSGAWSRLTQIIAYATEAHLFITDLNQSPFNVGTQLFLQDFSHEQVADLNGRYGSPLKTVAELDEFFSLVGGHPYLVQRCLYMIVQQHLPLDVLSEQATRDEGPLGDHLRRMLVLLARDPDLTDALRGLLRGEPIQQSPFYRLRSAGLLSGESAREAKLRCALYQTYLSRHLL